MTEPSDEYFKRIAACHRASGKTCCYPCGKSVTFDDSDLFLEDNEINCVGPKDGFPCAEKPELEALMKIGSLEVG